MPDPPCSMIDLARTFTSKDPSGFPSTSYTKSGLFCRESATICRAASAVSGAGASGTAGAGWTGSSPVGGAGAATAGGEGCPVAGAGAAVLGAVAEGVRDGVGLAVSGSPLQPATTAADSIKTVTVLPGFFSNRISIPPGSTVRQPISGSLSATRLQRKHAEGRTASGRRLEASATKPCGKPKSDKTPDTRPGTSPGSSRCAATVRTCTERPV